MKKITALLMGGILAALLAACAYTGVAASGDKVVVARTGMILGLMRVMYVCTVADNGLSNCQTNESP